MAIPSRTKLAKYFSELQKIEEHRSLTAEKEIQKLYTEMLTNLRSFLGVEYAKFAEDDVLKYSTLAQKGEYARFLEEVQAKVNYISPKVNKVITDTVKDVYKTAYEGMVEAVAKSVNDEELAKKLSGIKLTQPQVIKAAVNNPVAKLTLDKTLEKNRKQIVYNIKQTVTVGIMNGDRMSTMANKIKNDVDQNYRKAMLIARTEVHRVRETGHNNSSNEIDKKLAEADSKYRMVKIWRSKQDIKTRRTSKADHVKMHGQVVLQDEEFNLGDTTAPCPGESGKAHHDCNCRCRISRDLWSDEEFFEATGRHFKKVEMPKETPITEQVQSEVYGINNMKKPKRPSKRDFDNEEKYESAKAEYRERLSEYKKNLKETVDKNMNRKLVFKDHEEAEKWADSLGIRFKNGMQGYDLRAYNDVKYVLDEQLEKYPFLKNGVLYFDKEKLNASFMLEYTNEKEYIMDAINGIRFGHYFENYEQGLELVLDQMGSGFNVKGDGTVRTMIRHEIGHTLKRHIYYQKGVTNKMRIDMDNELISLAQKNLSGMSEYATTNEEELFAEGYASYSSGENTPFAKAFGKIFERWISNAFGI